MTREPDRKILLTLLLVYGLASLVHFTHNAEYLSYYPNLPATWTRAGIYLAWIGMAVTGVAGWKLVNRGYVVPGLIILAIYAVAGLDSLGHYIVAPVSAHSLAMNSTILIEVTTAAFVLVEIIRQLSLRVYQKTTWKHDV